MSTRLDGRRSVGPLQSLAGAMPADELTMRLEQVSQEDDTIRIGRPPLQTTAHRAASPSRSNTTPAPQSRLTVPMVEDRQDVSLVNQGNRRSNTRADCDASPTQMAKHSSRMSMCDGCSS